MIRFPAAFTHENLDGDWYVPGSTLGGPISDPFWKSVKELGELIDENIVFMSCSKVLKANN